jgi:hypothetical protein
MAPVSFWDLVQEFGWDVARWYLLGGAVVLVILWVVLLVWKRL